MFLLVSLFWFMASIEDVKAHNSPVERITQVRNGRVAWLCVQEVAMSTSLRE